MLLQSAIGITKCERTDVFSFVVHAEFEVGVLAPEEFRWKIFLGEDLEPLVVLVCHLHGKLFVMLTEPPSVEGNLTSESAPRVQVPYHGVWRTKVFWTRLEEMIISSNMRGDISL